MSFIRTVEYFRKKFGKTEKVKSKVEIKNAKRIPEQRTISTPMINYTNVIENEIGKLIVDEKTNSINVVDYNKDSILYPLTPLFHNKNVSEIFIRNDSIVATYRGRRYKISVGEFNVNEFMENIAISQGVILNLSKPYSETYLSINGSEWRIYLKLLEKEVLCAKIIKIPGLVEYDRILGLRLLMILLRPSIICIAGPTGSGKTTLLNSILNEVIRLFPHLKISVIEQTRELVLPSSAMISRAIAYSNFDVTYLLRNAFRYERPSIIVLGELRGENIETWFEISKGLASLTTIHANSLPELLSYMSLTLRKIYPRMRVEEIYSIVNCIVFMEKIEEEERTIRKIREVYLYDRDKDKMTKIYPPNIPENIFRKYFHKKLIVGDYDTVYNFLKNNL